MSGIAVLYPWFGDAATSIQSTGHWFCREEGTPQQIKTVLCPFFDLAPECLDIEMALSEWSLLLVVPVQRIYSTEMVLQT